MTITFTQEKLMEDIQTAKNMPVDKIIRRIYKNNRYSFKEDKKEKNLKKITQQLFGEK